MNSKAKCIIGFLLATSVGANADIHEEQNQRYLQSKGKGKGKGGMMGEPKGKGKGATGGMMGKGSKGSESKGKGGMYTQSKGKGYYGSKGKGVPYGKKTGKGKGQGKGWEPAPIGIPDAPYGKKAGKGKGKGWAPFPAGIPDFSESAHYRADLGPFGSFDLEVSDAGTMRWTTNLQHIGELEGILIQQEGQGIENGDFPIDSLSYHLHSMWRHTDAHYHLGAEACGNNYLGGHYDPTLACGPASSAQANGLCASLDRTASSGYDYSCEGAYFENPPQDFMRCEIGDLSGKYGSLQIHDDRVYDVVHKDPLPALNAHYDEFGFNENDPTKFSAILIHNGGPRVLCGKLVRV